MKTVDCTQLVEKYEPSKNYVFTDGGNKRVIDLPTGKIVIDKYSKGELETLSIGDYGKDKNIRAQFLGFNEEINGVANGPVKSLTEKWVMTLSTQYGCPMKCRFCDVPNVKFGGNATVADLYNQFVNARNCYPGVKYTDRLNIHFARMGEPTFNHENVFQFAESLISEKFYIQYTLDFRIETIHPVFTTMLPKVLKKNNLENILAQWCIIKNDTFNGQAGLQLSINTTDEEKKNYMFYNRSHSLKDISLMARYLPPPVGRKYCLNFAITSSNDIDANKLAELFDPMSWMVKITPIHNNDACKENGFKTENGYCSYEVYREAENNLIEAGFDVIVFVPSMDEENGTITCGNAILGGSKIKL